MKTDKEKARILEQIQRLQTELKTSITKKTHNKKELSIGDYQRKIADLQKQLI
jgi:hypothetical protein